MRDLVRIGQHSLRLGPAGAEELMLCRRCGMESSTTDVCEWCKRPMLPAGAAVRAVETAATPTPPAAQQPPREVHSTEQPELAAELQVEETQEVVRPAQAGDLLRPLGGHLGPQPSSPKPSASGYGLSEEATRTSVNVDQYLGPDDSLFRPMRRPEHSATSAIGDPLAMQRRRATEKAVSDIPDNVRLRRSLVAGLLIAFPLAIAQFVISKQVPDKLFVLPLPGGSSSFLGAIVWGVASGVFVGFGLGAMLVHFKKGPAVGLILGLILGRFGLATDPWFWGVVAAGLTGYVVGRIAITGYRRTVQV